MCVLMPVSVRYPRAVANKPAKHLRPGGCMRSWSSVTVCVMRTQDFSKASESSSRKTKSRNSVGLLDNLRSFVDGGDRVGVDEGMMSLDIDTV